MENQKPFHAQTTEEVLKEVHSSEEGLKQSEVEKRLKQYGLNKLPEPVRTTWFVLFFKQCKSFLIVLLLIAAGLSYFLHDETDAYIILAAVLMNVIVGFIQESKAERALEALRKVITLKAKVLRHGVEKIIDATQLVPGDMILLDSGDKVPADARLVDVVDLETNEAPLTGESNSIKKILEPLDASSGVGDRTNMVFTGTTVTRGSGRAVVVHTGVKTEIGRIAELLQKTKQEETPLQKKLDRFAKGIGYAVIGICVIIVVVGLFLGMDLVEIIITAVAIAVSAIPEGLVVAVTIILAIGMQKILKRNALVRNLQAAETLGSTSVICTDKTGTLTEGNMQVVSLVTHDHTFDNLHQAERHQPERIHELIFALNVGMLCNDAHVIEQKTDLQDPVVVGNLTERALLTVGINLGLDQAKLKKDEPRLATIPFDSKIKFMATLHQHPKKGHRIYVKGAPEKIMQMSKTIRVGEQATHFTPVQRKKFEKAFIDFSSRGLRILALAYTDVKQPHETFTVDDCQELTFVGFIGINDPLRPHIKETFEKTQRAGIRTIMITGDHKLTAKAIASELGFAIEDHNILEGEELHQMTQEQLNDRVEDIYVYARVSPEDKLNIIQAWKSKNKVVAMTGDGVNDSPALKAADIGVALGSGTDVAKEAADIVLLDDNFKTIVAAVEEGRGIFDTIRKVVLYLISDSFSEVVLITTAMFLGWPIPLTAAQILWINLVADGLPNVALTVEPREKEIMNDPPRPLDEPVTNREMKLLVAVISVATGIGNLAIFWYFWKSSGDVELARSVVFATLAVDSLLYVFSVRSLRHSIFHRSFFSNPWLLAAVGAAFIIQLSAFYVPALQRLLKTVALGTFEWSVIFGVSAIVIVLIEAIKYSFIVVRKRQQNAVIA